MVQFEGISWPILSVGYQQLIKQVCVDQFRFIRSFTKCMLITILGVSFFHTPGIVTIHNPFNYMYWVFLAPASELTQCGLLCEVRGYDL